MAGELTKKDAKYHDGRIRSAIKTWSEVTESLLIMRDHELWRDLGHKTWAGYLKSLPMSERHARRLISDGRALLEDTVSGRGTSKTTGDVPRAVDKLTTHARRALRQVPEEKKDEVLESANAAADRAGATSLTAEHVAQGVRDVLQPPVKDMEGNDAPQRLADIFDLAEELKHQISHMRAVSKVVLGFAQKDGGAFIQTGTVKTLITRLTREISDTIPWALCGECAGEGCTACGKRGWFTKGQMREISE